MAGLSLQRERAANGGELHVAGKSLRLPGFPAAHVGQAQRAVVEARIGD